MSSGSGENNYTKTTIILILSGICLGFISFYAHSYYTRTWTSWTRQEYCADLINYFAEWNRFVNLSRESRNAEDAQIKFRVDASLESQQKKVQVIIYDMQKKWRFKESVYPTLEQFPCKDAIKNLGIKEDKK